MSNRYNQYISREQKNRTIVGIFWVCIALMTTVELLDYVIYQFVEYTFVIENFFVRYIVFPLCLNVTIGGIVTLLYHWFNKKHPHVTSYIVILGFLLFIHGVITIHYGVSVIYMAYALPLFISIVFIDKKLTKVTAILSMILYIPLYFFYLPLKPGYTYKHDYMDFTATIIFTVGCYIITIFIMRFFDALMIKIADVSLVKDNLEKEVQLDSFTQLYNRATFDETLNLCFQKRESEKKSFTTIMLDLDNFKHINDTYGHSLGDEVILALVSIINETKRETDKAFRYGGDEFTLILETDAQGAFLVAEKIRERFQKMLLEGMENVHFSVSIGICQCDKTFLSVEQYFTQLDVVLYAAKQSGKNKTVIAHRQKDAE